VTPPAPNGEPSILRDQLSDAILQNTKVHQNVHQDVIIITEDKVQLCLLRHINQAARARDWLTPGGILLAIVTTFTTSTFNDALGLDAAVWKALFVMATVATVVWLIVTFRRAFSAPSLEEIVTEMKRAGEKSNES
jgi:hypothetical protein